MTQAAAEAALLDGDMKWRRKAQTPRGYIISNRLLEFPHLCLVAVGLLHEALRIEEGIQARAHAFFQHPLIEIVVAPSTTFAAVPLKFPASRGVVLMTTLQGGALRRSWAHAKSQTSISFDDVPGQAICWAPHARKRWYSLGEFALGSKTHVGLRLSFYEPCARAPRPPNEPFLDALWLAQLRACNVMLRRRALDKSACGTAVDGEENDRGRAARDAMRLSDCLHLWPLTKN